MDRTGYAHGRNPRAGFEIWALGVDDSTAVRDHTPGGTLPWLLHHLRLPRTSLPTPRFWAGRLSTTFPFQKAQSCKFRRAI